MDHQTANRKILTHLLFRLLPVQVLRDDCVPFDPGERQRMTADDDPVKNIGIRMVYRIARDVQYQNMLGMNVLTVRI